jgi:hypothetical protein
METAAVRTNKNVFAVMEIALYYTALVQGSVLNGHFIHIAVT